MHILLGTQHCLYRVNVIVYQLHDQGICTSGTKKDSWYYAFSKKNKWVKYTRSNIWFSCLFFEPTSSLRRSILVGSLAYFSIPHPCFASLFYSSLLYIFHACILASRAYFSRVTCLLFEPTSSLCEGFVVVESNWIGTRQAVTESHLNH